MEEVPRAFLFLWLRVLIPRESSRPIDPSLLEETWMQTSPRNTTPGGGEGERQQRTRRIHPMHRPSSFHHSINNPSFSRPSSLLSPISPSRLNSSLAAGTNHCPWPSVCPFCRILIYSDCTFKSTSTTKDTVRPSKREIGEDRRTERSREGGYIYEITRAPSTTNHVTVISSYQYGRGGAKLRRERKNEEVDEREGEY